MTKNPRPRSASVKEPVQAYLAPDDSDLLNRLTGETGLSKAEVLRRGLRSFAREQGGESPMLRFLSDSGAAGWPDAIAIHHDDALAEAYTAPRKKRR